MLIDLPDGPKAIYVKKLCPTHRNANMVSQAREEAMRIKWSKESSPVVRLLLYLRVDLQVSASQCPCGNTVGRGIRKEVSACGGVGFPMRAIH